MTNPDQLPSAREAEKALAARASTHEGHRPEIPAELAASEEAVRAAVEKAALQAEVCDLTPGANGPEFSRPGDVLHET